MVFPFLFCNFPFKLYYLNASTFYIVKMRFCLLAFHIYTQPTNIKLQTQFFTTITLVQFSVSKSPPFNVSSLITVQLACNITEVVNTLHPEIFRGLPTPCNTVSTGSYSSCSVVTMSECHAKYTQPLFINSIHTARFNSTNLVSKF